MTDTFQGGKGAFRKDRKINMKESRHRKEEQKRNVFTFSLDYIKESGRQLSDLCPTAGKRLKKKQSLCDKWETRVRPVLNKRKSWNKSWLTGLTTAVVGWLGKKHIWTRGKQGFDLYLQSENPGRKVDWEWLVDWKKRIWPRIDPELMCPPKNVLKPELTDRLDNSGWLTERKLGCTSIANHRRLLHHRTSDIHNFKTTKNYQRRVIDIIWCTKNEMLTVLYKRYQVQIQIPHNYLIKIAYTSQNLPQTVNNPKFQVLPDI